MKKPIRRGEWGARPAKRVTKGTLSKASTGHWNGPTLTVGGRTSWSHAQCYSTIRGIQNFHMDGRGWSDIAYNFLVCQHGYVFEGRGLNVINAANGTNLGNKTSHAIMCPAGADNPFTDDEKIAFRECVEYVAKNSNAPNQCIGHRDHKSTQCPGEVRYRWIRNGMDVLPQPPQSPITNSFGNWPNLVKPIIKFGSNGQSVRYLQNVIALKCGGNIAVDGAFGNHTLLRVKDVQRYFKLSVDGIVGPNTWKLIDALARQ